jgi:murein DD-endopeptidase MepM/ murein hydrolase activator NlpD
MQKNQLIILGIIIIALAGFFVWRKTKPTAVNPQANVPPVVVNNPNIAIPAPPEIANNNHPDQNAPAPSLNASGFQPPLPQAGERVTKKPFGIFITPQNSPVQPERFRGYHTGADFEIFPAELNSAVTVHAVCTGKLLTKEYATGYGGVAVQACVLNGQPITVVYGHLKLASIVASAGTNLNAGDTLGVLGAAYSSETNGERKHLHLGFHKGAAINILGYVQSQAALAGWIDPCLYVCHN